MGDVATTGHTTKEIGTMYDEDDDYAPEMCECEADWSCPLHSGRLPWLDRRYQGLDAEEAGR